VAESHSTIAARSLQRSTIRIQIESMNADDPVTDVNAAASSFLQTDFTFEMKAEPGLIALRHIA
jgi:hypothetical protein